MALRRVPIFSVVFFCLFLIIPLSLHSAGESLTLQIYPYGPSSKILNQFKPFADYLKLRLNREVIVQIAKDNNDHFETVGNDKADIAFLGPSTYVKIADTFGKKPIIARIEINGSPLLQGVIFTSSASPVSSLRDLKGKRFAFGYNNSTMSHLIPLYMLQQEGVQLNDLAQYKFLNDQYNVALGVLMGDFDAGAVNASVFHKYKGRGLKDLAWSPKVSEHLFVARASLPEATVTELRKAFFDLKKDKNALIIMSSMREGLTALVPAADKDYDNLRLLLRKLKKVTSAP